MLADGLGGTVLRQKKGPQGKRGTVSRLGGVSDVEQPKDGIHDLALSLRLCLAIWHGVRPCVSIGQSIKRARFAYAATFTMQTYHV
jgi:hypothetical protein